MTRPSTDRAIDTAGDRTRGRTRAGIGRGGDDDARKLHARQPWQGWLVLVFALDLENVEEVGAARADLDQVFVRVRGGRGNCGDGELLRSRDILTDLDGFHFERDGGDEDGDGVV